MIVPKEKLISKYTSRFNMSREKFPKRDYSKLEHMLTGSTFFDDPASKGHHNNFPGGLAQHILNLTSCLESLIEAFDGRINFSSDDFDPFLVALCHDLNKVNFYDYEKRNVKVDNNWVEMISYRYKKNRDEMPSASVSLGIATSLVQLSKAERLAIYWAEGSWSTYGNSSLDSAWKNAMAYDGRVYLTHTADMVSSQLMEEVLSDADLNKAIREWK